MDDGLVACLQCCQPLPPRRLKRGGKYCSDACQRAYYRARYEPQVQKWNSVTTGAIAELMVAAELMRRGYEVFRSMTYAASCDLAILKNGTLLRIEVRTAHRLNGNLFWKKNLKNGRYDHYALVLHNDNQIIFEPPLPQ